MEFIRTEDINYKPHLAQAVVELNDSPVKSAHLYHPHLYKEVLVNQSLLDKYGEGPDAGHRTVTNALISQQPPVY